MAVGKKKVAFIINPVSGVSNKKNIPGKAEAVLDKNKFDIEILKTEYAGHGYELARQAAANGADYVIAVGGDGTVNDIGRGLLNSNATMGIIPLGSGNGLARDLHISLNVEKALQIINEEHVITMDYGMANDRVFFCTCGVGFDANVAHKVAGKKKRGFIMYLKEMTKAFFGNKPEKYEVESPDGCFNDRKFLITCANTGQYGYGAYIAPHADVQDGLLAVSMLAPINLLNVPKIAIQMFNRTLDKNKKLTEILTPEVVIKREEEGPMHLDGDSYMEDKEIHVRIIPKGLKVLVPKKG